MARTLFKPLFTAVLLSAFIFSTLAISPTDLSHLPTEPLCFTPLAGGENTQPPASYIYDGASLFHPSPYRLTVPDEASDQLVGNPLLAAVLPYAQQYMGHRTRNTQKSNGLGAGVGDSSSGNTSNTTVHAWFIIFLIILGGLAWTAHHTVKSADNEEKKEKERKAAEQAEKDKFKRSLIVGPVETIELPIDGDGEIIREDYDQYENREGEVSRFENEQGNSRYVNPNHYSVHEDDSYVPQENSYAHQENNYTYQQNGHSHHENGYSHQENGYSQQENGYYENQEPVVHYDQGNAHGSSNYEQQQGERTENYQPQGYQQNGQYYDDRQALGQYGASQGPSDYGNYQYEDDQDLANLVDEK